MLPALRAILLVIVMAGLAGCAASPRYQTAYRYEPPLDATGRACLEKCEHKLAGCQQSCTADYQACLHRIEPQVDKRYNEALKHYQAEMDQYRWELRRYEFFLTLNLDHDFWYDRGFYHPWPGPYYFPPIPPSKPSRHDEFNQLQKEQCAMDCGCQAIYDACFLGCGGKRIPETRCIANCPEEK